MKTNLTNSDSKLYYVSGDLTILSTEFHNTFLEYRFTPTQLRASGPYMGFQTHNPLHQSHVELIRKSAVTGLPTLLHPVEGVTQECDVPFPVRMKCYQNALPYFQGTPVKLAILSLSMRMAGPREAVWHAVIRRNYGCSYFIVGRNHAGPSYRKKDGSAFYDIFAAQELAKLMESQIGITIVTSEEVVYCDDMFRYMSASSAAGHPIKNLSGTQLRSMLEQGIEVPRWYSYPEVVKTLEDFYQRPKGVCIYFVGLSGSGKSTLAVRLRAKFHEEMPHREVTILDADEIRRHLSKGLGFSREDRSTNVRRIGYVASEIVKHGGIVIVANIAPYEEDRQCNREMISAHGAYMEVFVDTPIETCEKRDVKGLYKAARAGTLANFTGVSDPFEVPTRSDLILGPEPLTDQIKKVSSALALW